MRLIVVVATLCAAVALCESSFAQSDSSGDFRDDVRGSIEDGKVALRFEEAIMVSGLNLKSEGDFFVPIPPGTTTAPAAPFAFLLANNPNNVSYAAIPGLLVEISGTWVSEVEYTGPLDGVGQDLSAALALNNFGGGLSFPTEPQPPTPPMPDLPPVQVCFAPNFQSCVPEPSAFPMAALGVVGLLSIRGRRNVGFGTRIEETVA